MKANAPENLYIDFRDRAESTWRCAYTEKVKDNDIEYTRTDAFIEKVKKWFEKQPEQYDANGVRVYGEEDFEDFVNYIKESKL